MTRDADPPPLDGTETAEYLDQSMLHPVDFRYRKIIRHLLGETLQQVTVASNGLLEGIHHLGPNQVLRRNHVVQVEPERLLENIPLRLPILLRNRNELIVKLGVDLRSGVRDKGAVEAAVFRPQTGYYNSIEEDAAALMESLGNNHGFLDGNKRIAFTATDVFLRRNGFYIEVEGLEGHAFIYGSMDRHEFRFAQILDWIRQHVKSLV